MNTSDLNQIRKINSPDLRRHLTDLIASTNIELVCLLTEGYNLYADESDEPGCRTGTCGFELHFRGAESSLVSSQNDSLHPATLVALIQAMDAMTTDGYEVALTVNDACSFVLIAIG